MTPTGLAILAATAAKGINRDLRADIPDEIVDLIYAFAGGAVAASFIPVPGLDVAVATADVWVMYTQINRKLGISFSKNLMKSIGSAVIANLTANLGQIGISLALKLIPGVGTAVGGTLMAVTVFGTTVAAGWVYLKALCKFYESKRKSGDGSEKALKDAVDDVLKNDKDGIRDAYKDGKDKYKK